MASLLGCFTWRAVCPVCAESRRHALTHLLVGVVDFLAYHALTVHWMMYHACDLATCGFAHVKDRVLVLVLRPRMTPSSPERLFAPSQVFTLEQLGPMDLDACFRHFPDTRHQKYVHESMAVDPGRIHYAYIGPTTGWVLLLMEVIPASPDSVVPYLIPFEAVAFSDASDAVFDDEWGVTAMTRIGFGVFPRRKAKQSLLKVGDELVQLVPRLASAPTGPEEPKGVWDEVVVSESSPCIASTPDPQETMRILKGSSSGASPRASTAAVPTAPNRCTMQCAAMEALVRMDVEGGEKDRIARWKARTPRRSRK